MKVGKEQRVTFTDLDLLLKNHFLRKREQNLFLRKREQKEGQKEGEENNMYTY